MVLFQNPTVFPTSSTAAPHPNQNLKGGTKSFIFFKALQGIQKGAKSLDQCLGTLWNRGVLLHFLTSDISA